MAASNSTESGAPAPTPTVNSVATSSYNQNSDLYDQVRPEYISEAVDSFVARLNLGPGSKVIDLAAGTGKFTKALIKHARENKIEYDIEAVEPSTGMIRVFSQNFPQIPVHKAGSYELPFPDDYADAIVIAQGFHWFSDLASLKEMARILRPNGVLGMIWNYDAIESLPESNPQRKITQYIWTLDHNVPQYRRMHWHRTLLDESQIYFKQPYHDEHFLFTVQAPRDPDYFWKYWQSRSYVTALSKEDQEKVKQNIYKLYSESEIDPTKDYIDIHRGTHVVWMTLK